MLFIYKVNILMKSDSITYHILSMKKLDTLYHMHKYDDAIVVSCLAICVNHTTTRQYSSRVDVAYTTDST